MQSSLPVFYQYPDAAGRQTQAPPQPYGGPGRLPGVANPATSCETQDGVRYMYFYYILTFFCDITLFGLAIAAAIHPAGMPGWVCGLWLLMLLPILFFILAFLQFNSGSDEFGPDHAASVKRAQLLFIIGLIISFVTAVAIPGLAIGMLFSGSLAGVVALTLFPSGLGIIFAVLWGLLQERLIRHFTTPDERRRCFFGLLMFILGACINFTVAAYLTFGSAGIPAHLLSVRDFIPNAGKMASAIGEMLFLSVYSAVLHRFKSGAVTMPPRPQYGWPQGPAGHGYPAYPTYPRFPSQVVYPPPPGQPPYYPPPPY